MPLSRRAQGKKRERAKSSSDVDESDAGMFMDSQPAPAPRIKKQKRAETRVCPVCDEAIPVRLLGKHSEFEMARVEEIMHHIGSAEVLADAEPDEGLTSRSRRSTLKVRKGITGSALASTSETTLDQIPKVVRMIRNRRKQRHAKLREMTRGNEDALWWGGRRFGKKERREGTVCPICAKVVMGDLDVVEAHVDSCIAHVRMSEEQSHASRHVRRDMDFDLEVDIDGEAIESVTAGVNFQGTGFNIRDRTQQDIDDEVDVDGEDEMLYGAAQFSEGDIIALSNPLGEARYEEGDVEVDADADTEESGDTAISRRREENNDTQDAAMLRSLVAEGKSLRRRLEAVEDVKQTIGEVIGVDEAEEVDSAIEKVLREGDRTALIEALERKVNLMVSTRVSTSTSLICRICLDPYTEPTVSTGCWHTCCRECWLRCLGSTKLCPICKRITAAVDLRGIYL
ncbi:uncharacterized protein LAESUDRAFT_726940 [Laetiporus sulphureus 93-53]|uniref:RING-type domain-containing protein n=1 Tax=Laetiporus sulphureus 93-53 TaxID=1314785 RepID=A0A165DUI9_9APHY|nr:uncharacterized protein LAESUDRAFT_726940 [Laetiporus sulphureus 93-53]KZT05653.1 hypothetical protein LAESUDRAFT_726940 [Laetiporus sulphureus 93-53]